MLLRSESMNFLEQTHERIHLVGRRLINKDFKSLSFDARTLEVPPIIEDVIKNKSHQGGGGDSSTGENSSPETPTEPEHYKNETQKEKKKKKRKKDRQPTVTMSPPADAQVPVFFADDIRHRDGGQNKKNHDKISSKNSGLSTPKIEKSSSFKRKTKPPYLESMMAREYNSDQNSKSPSRPDSRNNNNNTKNDTEYNIVLLGDFGVGKTALAVRFVTRRYLHEYDPTLERTYEKQIQCSNGSVKVKLWDTVNKSFDVYTEYADGFIVMYSTTSSQTSQNAQNTIKTIRASKYAAVRSVPILLLGTKCELEHARKVHAKEQEAFAKAHGCLWREISVACTINIDGTIKGLIEEIIITDNGRIDSNGHSKLTATTSLSRKPSAAKKHLMKSLLSSKKKEKS
ncbi:ras-like protein family member 12 isoform X2 [Clytia hemisphaerica]|uniref:ras-like protein family member 12 isoform X2 n=1 Tax=Clytia hemisphaerica TaxID=252671 RepID=UPI0034D7127E